MEFIEKSKQYQISVQFCSVFKPK